MNAPQIERLNGIGLGLRYPLAEALFANKPKALRFVEVHPENYLARGGRFEAMLEQAQEHWPVLSHGLSLGFGNLEAFDPDYTKKLRRFLNENVKVPWHSEHLCFTQVAGQHLHDLLPLPFTKEAIEVSVRRIKELQDALCLPVAIENVSYYADILPPAMPEIEFLLEVLDKSDALLLLDVNNVYVNSENHRFDPRQYIDQIPPQRVAHMHMAGHWRRKNGSIVDTHAEAICEDVYALFEHTMKRMGPKPVLLERDDNFPDFKELEAEVGRLHAIYQRATLPKSEEKPLRMQP
ncbi:MAG: DUF692 domain-containing protein [Myxococcales bacterium]|nr:MAG: DUF692 domain-containing protein [Myxococcales bacterium]